MKPFELSTLTKNIQKKTNEEYYLRKFITHYQWIKKAIQNIETANTLQSDKRKQIKKMRSEYKPDDLILIKHFNRKKLDPFFIGPLKIVKKEFNTITVCNPQNKLQIEIYI